MLEISKEQYAEWRNHPATLFYRRLLKDRADSLIRAGTEAWLNNDSAFSREEARGRIRELLEIESVSYDTIVTFYQERKDADAGTIEGTS